MPRKQRDFKAEYARRIAKGLAAGKTRSQARGHAADKKGAVAASRPDLRPKNIESFVSKLRGDRSVKVVATLEGGGQKVIARGKASGILEWIDEYDSVEDWLGDEGDGYDIDDFTGVQVIYQ